MAGNSLRDAAVRAAFLDHFRATSLITAAARRAGVSVAQVSVRRRDDADFRAAVLAVRGDLSRPLPQRRFVRLTADRRAAFLAALGQHGSVERAADAAGVGVSAVTLLRRRDAVFSGNWAAAKNEALDRVEDRLFDAVLHGFTRTETVNGVTRTTRTQNAAAMFRLLARRAKADSRYKTLLLTPEIVEDARERVERRIREEAAERAAQLAAPGLALPPPTVTAAPDDAPAGAAA